MKQIALLALGLLATLGVEAQTYKFDFTTGKKTKDGYTCLLYTSPSPRD